MSRAGVRAASASRKARGEGLWMARRSEASWVLGLKWQRQQLQYLPGSPSPPLEGRHWCRSNQQAGRKLAAVVASSLDALHRLRVFRDWWQLEETLSLHHSPLLLRRSCDVVAVPGAGDFSTLGVEPRHCLTGVV
eukprot:1725209-Rhodomonas_salina.3